MAMVLWKGEEATSWNVAYFVIADVSKLRYIVIAYSMSDRLSMPLGLSWVYEDALRRVWFLYCGQLRFQKNTKD